jgi:hypothetical protein
MVLYLVSISRVYQTAILTYHIDNFFEIVVYCFYTSYDYCSHPSRRSRLDTAGGIACAVAMTLEVQHDNMTIHDLIANSNNKIYISAMHNTDHPNPLTYSTRNF